MHGVLDTEMVDMVGPVNRLCPYNRGLVAWWKALPGLTGGSTWIDINNPTSGFHGVVSGAKPILGEDGTARLGSYFFNGTTDIVTIADNDAFSFGDGSVDRPFSISFWVNRAANTTESYLYKSPAASNDEWVIGGLTNNTGRVYFFLTDLSASARIGRFASALAPSWDSLSLGKWASVVCAYDGTSLEAGIKIYINGVRKDNNSFSTGSYVAMENSSNTIKFAGEQVTFGGGSDFGGYMDDVQIYNRELSASEVYSQYLEAVDGYPNRLNWLHLGMPMAVTAGGGGATAVPVFYHHYQMQGMA